MRCSSPRFRNCIPNGWGWPSAIRCAFAAGEWWRVVTALFAYDDGPVQKLGIVFGVLALGIVAERKIGTVEWLIIAFVSGLAGQIVGLWWQPVGAGSSVAVAGLLGATATWLAWPKTPLPWFARIGSRRRARPCRLLSW